MALSKLVQIVCTILPLLSALVQCRSAPLKRDQLDWLNSVPDHQPSSGSSALCGTPNLYTPVTAQNTKILLPELENQWAVTQFIQNLFSVNSTTAASATGLKYTLKDTYQIDGTLCVPKDLKKVDKVLVLSHGVGLDKTYWDITANYSFVEAATKAGYATYAYNRLGVGRSSKPDPLQAVQSYAEVEVLHSIATQLRSRFSKVIGVAHSYGSVVQLGNNAKYPDDLDASVVTGMSNELTFLGNTILSNNPTIASPNLPKGYLVHNDAIAIAQPFLKWPYYSQDILDKATANKGLYTVGQILTLPGVFSPASNYSKPVDVVLGDGDYSFCGGNCNYNGDLAASTLASFWPARQSGSQSYIVPKCGHLINFHFSAQQAYSQILKFLKANGV